MRIKFLLKLSGVILLWLSCMSSYAQVVKITGKITESKGGQTLPGLTVSVKGKQVATVTNIDGIYNIQANPANDVLIFSMVGFQRQEVKIGGKTTINITMNEDQSKLDEVVVVGYGTKRKSEVIGAVATIKGAEIEDVAAPDIAGALRNRIAGVGVSAQSGAPGASISLNIRDAHLGGNVTVSGATTEPLYVIDGITSSQGQFDMLDPSMVEDITILKDASAAIYGASGSKGVVLITTKRGKSGKPQFTYNGYVGINDASKKTKMLTGVEQAQMLNDLYDVQGFAGSTKYFSAQDLQYLKDHQYKSWFDEIWQASVVQRHNLSMSGGSEKVTFFVGGAYQNNNANYKGTYYNRKFSFRSGVNATFSESLKADISFNVNSNKNYTNLPVSPTDQNYVKALLSVPQWVPIQINGMPVNYNSVANPLAQAQSGYYESKTSSSYTLNAALSYTPKAIPGLALRFQIGQTGTWGGSEKYSPPYKQYTFYTTGGNGVFLTDSLKSIDNGVAPEKARLNPGLNRGSSYQANVTLNYAKSIGAHSFSVLVGGEQSQSSSQSASFYWDGQLVANNTDYWAFNQGAFTNSGYTLSESIKQSFFGRFSYDYKKKYLIDAVGRFDGSANFATGHVWGFFPSVGAAWIMSEEDFFKNISSFNFISYLKLKATVGLTGDDRINSRLWQATYGIDSGASGAYLFGSGNALSIGFSPSQIPNPDITWQKKRTYNFGLETAFFNGRLTLGVDYFHDFVYDEFDKNFAESFPQYAGFAAPVVNHEEHHTYGTEFTIGYNGNLNKDLKFNTSVNFGFNNGYVSQIYTSPSLLFLNTSSDAQTQLGTNSKIYNGDNVGLISKGILRTQADVDALLKQYPNYTIYKSVPEVGWLYYEDTNNDGIINENDKVPMFKNGTDPIITLGTSLGLQYKGFQFNTNLVARIGGHEMFDTKVLDNPTVTNNVAAIWSDRWSPSNPNGKFPRVDNPTNKQESTFWAVNATMVRINNMSLGYTLPNKISQRLGLSNLRMLVTGNNLWVLVNPQPTKDPYSSYIYDYPTIRTIQVGLSFGL